MSTFILELAGLSAVMAVIILVLMMLKKPLGRLSPWSRYVIWAVVILRLCVPVTLGGTPSIFTFELPDTVFAQKKTAQTEAVTSVMSEPYVPVIPSITESVQQSKPIVDTAVPENTVSPVTSDEPTVILPAVTEKSPQTQPVIPEKLPTAENKTEKPVSKGIDTEELLSALFAVWAMGAAVFFAYRMTGYAAFVFSVKKSGRVKKTEGRVARIYASVGEALGIKRLPALYVAYYPVSPMLCGYLKPKMIIPDLEFWDEDRIRAVLAHELIHYRRGDLYAKLLCTAAEALHWFNPAVHKAASRFNSAMELACDEIVIRKLGNAERAVYGDALLDIVRRCEGVKESPMTTALSGNAGAVKERIMNILDTGKKRRGISIIAVTLVICMIAGAVVGCAVKDSGNATETPVTENENGNGNENKNAEAVYYVPEYMKIVKANDTYEATLTFEGDKIIAERTKNGEEDVTYTAVFDGDRLTAVEVRNAEGELLRTKELSYDEVGNVTLISYTSTDNTREYCRTEYTYEDGRLKVLLYSEDDEPGRYKISYIYDENGRLISEDKECSIFSYMSENVKYIYDENGNMTYRETNTVKHSGNTTVKSTFKDDTAIVIDESSGNTYNNTYTFDINGNVILHRIECDFNTHDDDDVPAWAEQKYTYTEDGRHIISLYGSGSQSDFRRKLEYYDTTFNAEKLESSGLIHEGAQIKWRECTKDEYLRYCAVYETRDTLSEEAEVGYLLALDSHMWCFDDVDTDVAVDAIPYAPFEGKDAASEAEARAEWYAKYWTDRGGLGVIESKMVEAFLLGDIDTLAEYARATEGAYDCYRGMKIGDYKLEVRNDISGEVIALTVDILESNHELLTPGTHTLITQDAYRGGLYIDEIIYNGRNRELWANKYNEFAYLFARYEYLDVEKMKANMNGEDNGETTMFFLRLLCNHTQGIYRQYYEANDRKGITAENLKEYIYEYLDITGFEPYGDHNPSAGFNYEEPYYNILGRGDIGPAVTYEEPVVEGDTVTVTIHTWADQSCTVKSQTARFVLTDKDGAVKYVSSEILEDTGLKVSFTVGT